MGDEELEAAAPPSFLCPISHEIMQDPVSCTDGHSYERKNIQRWMAEGSRLSPITGGQLGFSSPQRGFGALQPAASQAALRISRNATEDYVGDLQGQALQRPPGGRPGAGQFR